MTDEAQTPPEPTADPWCTCGYRQSNHPDGACPTSMSRFEYSTFANDMTVSRAQLQMWRNERRMAKGHTR